MKIGIIGGGQLGMMIAEAAKKLNVKTIALDPNPNCSCKYICDEVIVGDYNDVNKLEELGKKSDVITYEFENIEAKPLEFLVKNYNLKQGIKQLYISQNRLREKEAARSCGLKTAPFYKISSYEDLKEAYNKLNGKAIYKTTTLGYDGHGQYVINNLEDLEKVKLGEEGILEGFVDFDYETSIIMVRDKFKTVSLEPTINYHKDGILDISYACKKNDLVFTKLKQASYKFMEELDIYGILTIEYFVKGDDFYFNEMAPRPHNSGHFSIEGSSLSQYDLLVNYLLDLPLEEPILLKNSVMKNILGVDYASLNDFKDLNNVYIHDYHKKEVKSLRKMAHITFTDINYDDFINTYNKKFKR